MVANNSWKPAGHGQTPHRGFRPVPSYLAASRTPLPEAAASLTAAFAAAVFAAAPFFRPRGPVPKVANRAAAGAAAQVHPPHPAVPGPAEQPVGLHARRFLRLRRQPSPVAALQASPEGQMTPWASIASATRSKPAMFAPVT